MDDSGENNRAKDAKHYDSEQLLQQYDFPGIDTSIVGRKIPLILRLGLPNCPPSLPKIIKNAIIYKKWLGGFDRPPPLSCLHPSSPPPHTHFPHAPPSSFPLPTVRTLLSPARHPPPPRTAFLPVSARGVSCALRSLNLDRTTAFQSSAAWILTPAPPLVARLCGSRPRCRFPELGSASPGHAATPSSIVRESSAVL